MTTSSVMMYPRRFLINAASSISFLITFLSLCSAIRANFESAKVPLELWSKSNDHIYLIRSIRPYTSPPGKSGRPGRRGTRSMLALQQAEKRKQGARHIYQFSSHCRESVPWILWTLQGRASIVKRWV